MALWSAGAYLIETQGLTIETWSHPPGVPGDGVADANPPPANDVDGS